MKRHIAVLGTVLMLAGVAVFCTRAEAADLQVTISVTISQSVSVAWGAGTSVDDNGVTHPAGSTSPFYWVAKDAAGTNLGLSEVVGSNDANNSKTIKVSCLSGTNSIAAVSGAVSVPTGWHVAATNGIDTFAILATLGTTSANLDSTQSVPLGTVATGTANDKALVLVLTTPSALTTLSNSQQVISVSMTATVAP